MNDQRKVLIWIDLEMTGLDPLSNEILEIATVLTDPQLNILAEGPGLAIYHEPSILAKMDSWNTQHHNASGLVERVLASQEAYRSAEQATLDFLASWLPPQSSPMCGNTICQDRRFLSRLMPNLEKYFHYRHIDVSTVKELAGLWAPEILTGFTKTDRHRALEDIKGSIAELLYYRDHFKMTPNKETAGAEK